MKHAPLHRRLRALVATGALFTVAVGAAVAPAPRHTFAASGGSIVYASGGNVWVARADGSHKHQVTRDGKSASPYEYPSQADNGTFEALRSNKLYRLNRSGRRLSKPVTVATGLSNKFSLHTLAFDPAISPNGQTVAYTLVTLQGVYNPTTGLQGLNIIAEDIQYRNASSGKLMKTFHLAGTYLMSPSWIDNSQLLVFAPYNIVAPEVYRDMIHGGGYNWFADSPDNFLDRQPLNHGELTRGKNMLAAIRGSDLKNDWRGTTIQIYKVSSFGSDPTPVCSLAAQHGAIAKVSWAPDGGSLAWSDSNGVWVSSVNTSRTNCGLSPRLVIRNGTMPDWGPAGA